MEGKSGSEAQHTPAEKTYLEKEVNDAGGLGTGDGGDESGRGFLFPGRIGTWC